MIELPSVEVKEKDVCVKMLAAPINPADINRIEGILCIKKKNKCDVILYNIFTKNLTL